MTLGRHYRHTRDSWSPKKPTVNLRSGKRKRLGIWGAVFLGVLAVALPQPGGAQVIPFKRAFGCVRALVDFHMIAHYRSHTSDTTAYTEDYLDQFLKLKGIFLEFQVTKRPQDKVDKQQKEIRHQKALISKNNTLRPVRPSRLTPGMSEC